MAVARESLSPLLKNMHTRRFSLELRQKIGNQVLSPSSSGNFNSSLHPVNSPMTGSPNMCCLCPDNSAPSPTTFSHRRRGSIDQDVFKSLSPCGGLPTCVKNSRRRSLTPLNALGKTPGQSHVLQGHAFPIPLLKINDSPQFQSPNKIQALCEHVETPTPKGPSFGESGLFRSVSPISAAIDRSAVKKSAALDQRRKSSSSRYDFDEEFMRFVFIKCNLQLFPEEILGRGSFGTVIQGKYHGQKVAVKVIKTNTSSHFESMKAEQNAVGLMHPHVAQVLDIFQIGPERSLVVMDLMKKGNLHKLLNDSRFPIHYSVKLRISGQIASALQYCHQKGILHLDVKPQNILIDNNNNCKLADFGTSKRSSDIPSMINVNRLEGTVAYKAPELFQNNFPNEKCDVYSFGICMWQILYREEPFRGLPEHAIIYQVVAHGLRPDRFACSTGVIIDDDFGPPLLQFVRLYENCWHAEPHYRPDMKTIVDKFLLMVYNV